MDLAVHQHRVQHRAAVVRDPVAEHADPAGVARHLDRGEVHPVGEGPVLGVVGEPRLQLGLDPVGQALPAQRLRGERREGEGATGRAADAALTVRDLEVLLVGLEQVRGHAQELLPERARGLEHRGAAGDRSAAVGAAVARVRRARGVAEHDADAIVRDRQHVGRDLRERRADALAQLDDAGRDGDAARRLEADRCRLVAALPVAHRGHELRRPHAGHFDVVRDADADQPAFRARARLHRAQPVVVGDAQDLVERARVVAAVVHEVGGAAVGERGRRHVVAAPDVDGVDPEARGRHVHQPLGDERRLLHAEGAVRAERHLVGHHAPPAWP